MGVWMEHGGERDWVWTGVDGRGRGGMEDEGIQTGCGRLWTGVWMDGGERDWVGVDKGVDAWKRGRGARLGVDGCGRGRRWKMKGGETGRGAAWRRVWMEDEGASL